MPLHPSFADCWRHHGVIMGSEAAAFHRERIGRHPEDYPPGIRKLIESGLRASAADLVVAREHQQLLRDESEAMFPGAWDVAAIPAATGAAPALTTTGDFAPQGPWSYLGLPVVSLPFATDVDGMPLAVQLVGQKWCEEHVLRAAVQLERDLKIPHRLPPVPTAT